MITPPTPVYRTSRRSLLASGLSALSLSCARHKGSGYPGYALIAAAGEHAIAVVDLTRFRHIKDIALNAEPRAILASPSGSVFALTPANGSIHRLTSDLGPATSYRWAQSLVSASLSEDGKWLAAIAADPPELLLAEADTLRVKSRHKLGAGPAYLTLGTLDFAAVSSGKAGLIELVQLSSGRHWQRQMSSEMGNLIFRADGQLLLAANLQDRSLTALSVPTLEIVAELPLAMRPDNLCFGSDGGQLFISGDGMDGIAIVFPYRVLQVDQTVLAGRDPGVMAVSGSPGYLFVGSASGSDVCVMNIDNRRIIGIVDVAQRPGFITVTPDNQYALVLNELSGDMAVIHVSAIRQNFLATSHRTGAALFTMLPVGDRPVHAVVVPGEV